MGTGIVSVALALDGAPVLSWILFAATALAWLVLTVLLAAEVLAAGDAAHDAMRAPGAFTVVAGTAVVGTRAGMAGWTWVAAALLALAAALWAMLVVPVLRHQAHRAAGIAFLVSVATESIALLASQLANSESAVWLLGAALAAFTGGLVLYVATLWRFDLHELLTGRGDHWIAGGALAIATLAGAHLAHTTADLRVLAHGDVLRPVALALWVAAMAWLPPLLFAELRRPRTRYDLRRWGTVFPLGMYAACGFVVARVDHAGAIAQFSQVWVWVAFAVWALVVVGLAETALLTRRN